MDFADLIELTDRAAQDHLGGAAVVYASSGGTVQPIGIFSENYVLVSRESGVEQVGPAVWLRLGDLPVHPDDDDPLITIAETGKTYRVRERKPDHGGGIVLLLHVVG